MLDFDFFNGKRVLLQGIQALREVGFATSLQSSEQR